MEFENNIGRRFRRAIISERGVWCIHRGVGSDTGYTVTHIPTKLAAVKHITSLAKAKLAMRELAVLPGKWGFTDHTSLSGRQIRAGRRIKRKYSSRPRSI